MTLSFPRRTPGSARSLAARPMAVSLAIMSLIGGASPTMSQAGQPFCKPALSIGNTSFSEPVNLQRIWRASIVVDASRCATSSGLFAVEFVRGKDPGEDVAFTEPFIWRAGKTELRVDFWHDESVEEFQVIEVAPCPCRLGVAR